jgi:hypothetical protein
LEAFEHLVAGRPRACPEPVSWELHLFGDGPTKQELESAAAARGWRAAFIFRARLPATPLPPQSNTAPSAPAPPLRRGNASPLGKASHVAGRSSQRRLAPFRSS